MNVQTADRTHDPGGPLTPLPNELGEPLVPAELVAAGEHEPPTVAGFTVERQLGRGGTGTVYLARQEPLERLVALKVLDPQLAEDETFTARFYREARAAALFQHPNVVAIHAAGQDPDSGAHWIAFEYMRGGSLEDLLAREGCLAERDALELILGVARGLVFAESNALVHRDVKPGNVLLTPEGVPKLADLGLAKQADPELKPITQQGVVIGTPYYMAPEQALGSPDLDCRADIYSLGLCLWRMVTGRVPFLEAGESGAGLVKVLARRLNQSLPDVREVAPELSHGLASLLKGMTARRRRDRYSSAREVIADLERVLRGELPVGPSPTVPLKRSLVQGGGPDTLLPPAATAKVEVPTLRQSGTGAALRASARQADPAAVTLPQRGPAAPLALEGAPATLTTVPLPTPTGLTTMVDPSPHEGSGPGPLAGRSGRREPPLLLLAGVLVGLGGGAWLLGALRAPRAGDGDPARDAVREPPLPPRSGAAAEDGQLPEPVAIDPPLLAPPSAEPASQEPPFGLSPAELAPGATAEPGLGATEPAPGAAAPEAAHGPEEPHGDSPPWSPAWIDETGYLLAVDVPRAAQRAQALRGEGPQPSVARRRFDEGLQGMVATLDPALPWRKRRVELERLRVTLEPRRGDPQDPLQPLVDQALARWSAMLDGARELRLALGDPRRTKQALDPLEDLPGRWAASAQARRVLDLCAQLDAPAADGPLSGPSPSLAIAELRRGAIGRVLGEELDALEKALTRIANDPARSRVSALINADLAPLSGTELVHGRVVTVPTTAGWSELTGARGLDLELSAAPTQGQAVELVADDCTLRLEPDRIGLDETARGGTVSWSPLAWGDARRLVFEARPGSLLLRIPGAIPGELSFPRDPSGSPRFTVRLKGVGALRLLMVTPPR